MDLCLRGSQINLVARQKPKPKYSSHSNLSTLVGGGTTSQRRPRSAPFTQRRTRSSPFLYRPQSADPKFERNTTSSVCGHNTYWQSENELPSGLKYNRNNKRFESVSSSNLLKLLLEEPIKRSWLCRSGGGGGGSSSEHSDLSSQTSRKTSSYSSLQQQRMRTESAGGSSIEGDSSTRFTNTPRNIAHPKKSLTSSTPYLNKMSSGSTISNVSKEKYTSSLKMSSSSDYWPSALPSNDSTAMFSSTYLPKSNKPDLPGRVSFSKPHGHTDFDSSDCDNDKQEPFNTKFRLNTPIDNSISAPGPSKITIPDFSLKREAHIPHSMDDALPSTSNSSMKKSVHFGAAGEEVLAETYEYPKCPSENCSCSTRSSSTASIHDVLDGKCACASPTCKYVTEVGHSGSLTELAYTDIGDLAKLPNGTPIATSPLEDSPVIRNYKNAVGGQLDNSIVKSLLNESKVKTNNMEVPFYLEKFSATSTPLDSVEKQNNLSEPKNGATYKSNSKRNLFGQPNTEHGNKSDNNMTQNLSASKTSFVSSSESVINNYLKVTGGNPILNKKKDNKPASAESSSRKPRVGSGKTLTHPPAVKQKSSEIGAVGSTKAKMKKATSFHNLREDSNLDAFNIDKVDSWMSMHEEAMGKQNISKHGSLGNGLEKYGKSEMDDEREEEQADSNSQISSKSEENSQDDSTYEEIVSVIKEIEEDKKQDNLAEVAVSEMELKLNTTSEMAESSQNVSDRTDAPDSPDKFKDILSYLDIVEDSCDKALLETRRSMPDSNRSEIEFVVEPDIVEDVPKLADLLLLPNHQLARRVVALSLRANELANGLQMSKEQVLKLRVEKQKSVRSEKANTTNRLREQKKHYELIVKRHQGFIEQLLKDKGTLCKKVAALTRRLESQNQAWEHKLETELARVKETTLAGEKIRRERWVRENTKKIKELTVKGLEMEINKMTAKHQQEVTELKRLHQAQLLDALEGARLKHEQIENGIRESSAQDRESIIEKERGAIRERFERQMEEERKCFDEQKQKLLEEFALERERLQRELKTKDVEHQTKRQELQREKETELEQTIGELQEKMSKQEEKYQNRINTIEKQYEADFEIWKREYENSCKLAQVEKENNIRQHYRAERDRQIDAIVSRMDSEALKNAEEYELKLSRFKEKHEKDLQDSESLEKSLREKYTETRGKLAESDAQVRNCQAELKQLQIELGHSKKMCNDFLAERDQLRDNLRNEMQSEVAALKVERDHEIQKIHKRVQQAIEKKDTTIDILQKENGDVRERCIKLEAIIRQQRKDYCIK